MLRHSLCNCMDHPGDRLPGQREKGTTMRMPGTFEGIGARQQKRPGGMRKRPERPRLPTVASVVAGLLAIGCAVETELDEAYIQGGYAIPIAEAPWQVAVYVEKPFLSGSLDNHFCGSGTLLDDQHVLVAASCVHGQIPSKIHGRVGDTDRTQGARVEVDAVQVHELYDPNISNSRHALAIIRLSHPLEFNDGVYPIKLAEEADRYLDSCVPRGRESYTESFDFSSCQFAQASGWGMTNGSLFDTFTQAYWLNTQLHAASLPILDSAFVFDTFRFAWRGSQYDDEEFIFAGANDTSLCERDEGAPLVVDVGGEPTLIGVGTLLDSFFESPLNPERIPRLDDAYDACNENFPSTFVRISHYRDWIDDTVSRLRDFQ